MIVTRQEALSQGLKTYFTGRPCKHEHVASRHTKSGICSECNKNACAKYQKENLDKFRFHNKAHYDNNSKVILERRRAKYPDNRERILEINDRWRVNNLGRVAAQLAKRRATLKQAIPKWADLEEIARIYENCPKGFHVDHYYPLESKVVCGLHTPENLVPIPNLENWHKGNKMPEEFYGL